MEESQKQFHGESEQSQTSDKVVRFIWTAAGTFFLALGLIGIAIPILPTTPFLLLAAACYLKGSKRMHRWLLTNRVFGRYLTDYREKRGIPIKVKIVTISCLWATMLFTAFVLLHDPIIQIVLLTIAAAVTAHILTTKNRRSEVV